jgi:hypothetical protein
MARKLLFLKIFMVFILMPNLVSAVTLYEGETASSEIVKAADEGMQKILLNLPLNITDELGLDGCDPEDAYLGTPYKIYQLKDVLVTESAEKNTVASMIEATQQWYFPVMIDDEVKTFLMVDYINGEWKATSVGNGPLAKKMTKVRKKLRERKGYKERLILSYQAKEFLYTVPKMSPDNLTSLTYDVDYLKTKDLKTELRRLKTKARKQSID